MESPPFTAVQQLFQPLWRRAKPPQRWVCQPGTGMAALGDGIMVEETWDIHRVGVLIIMPIWTSMFPSNGENTSCKTTCCMMTLSWWNCIFSSSHNYRITWLGTSLVAPSHWATTTCAWGVAAWPVSTFSCATCAWGACRRAFAKLVTPKATVYGNLNHTVNEVIKS